MGGAILDLIRLADPLADAQAKFREAVEKAMLGYPPDLSEDATQLVLKQAELSTEAGA